VGNLKVAIHQPNFMPWLGFFYKIFSVTDFVILDDAQIQKTGSSYVNRTSILLDKTGHFLTIPIIRGGGVRKINECEFSDHNFRIKLIKTIVSAYRKSPFYYKYADVIIGALENEADSLSEYNLNFIKTINALFEIKTKIHIASSLDVNTSSTQRLIDICIALDSDEYLSGVGGFNYQDIDLFNQFALKLTSVNYPKYKYKQGNLLEFTGGLSIIDAIFYAGVDDIRDNYFLK
jgi:hypothetical protein